MSNAAKRLSLFFMHGNRDFLLGDAFARAGGDLITGAAADGEVEDYEVEILDQIRYDLGDAPDADGYPVLLADDPARHVVPTPASKTYFLGAFVDYDTPDAFESALANGDDSDSSDPNVASDDEDGVFFNSDLDDDGVPDLVPGTFNVLDVIAQGPVSLGPAGYLNAWIDFNGDGDWDDPAEQIFDDFQLNDNNTTPSSRRWCAASRSRPASQCRSYPARHRPVFSVFWRSRVRHPHRGSSRGLPR